MSTTVRYPPRMIAKAREHHAHGWGYTAIVRLLHREFGHAPHRTAVAAWCDPSMRERKAAFDRRRRPASGTLGRVRTEGWKTERMRAWRAAGVSLSAICAVALVEWGDVLTVERVRYRLGKP